MLSAGDAEINQTVLVIEALSTSAGGARPVEELGGVVSRCGLWNQAVCMECWLSSVT